MRKLSVLPFLMVLLTALACLDDTPMAPETALLPEMTVGQAFDSQGDAVKMVPFGIKGTWWMGEGDPSPCEQYGYPDDPSVFFFFPHWDGTGLHLGHVTASTTNCFRAEPDGSRTVLMQANEMVAANGDRLYSSGSADDWGTRLVIYPDMSFEVLGIHFVGGTGRFEHAEGWYDLWGDNIYGGYYVITGEISSVGSSK